MAKDYDFGGWATKNNMECSDGRVIMQNAFGDQHGEVVPLLWNHEHNNPEYVIGHALLENRPEGVYTYGKFNDTELGKHAKSLVSSGDITKLSIWANKLKKKGPYVSHGIIREVSLVLAGANPGAYIEDVVSHDGITLETEFALYPNYGLDLGDDILEHSEKEPEEQEGEKQMENEKKTDSGEKTIKEIFNTLTEEQKTVVYALIGKAVEDVKNEMKDEDEDEDGEGDDMKHNVFENDIYDDDQLCHAEIAEAFKDAKKYGSLKDSFLSHGITNIDYLFPEAQTLSNTPEFVKRDTGWVTNVMGKVHKSPFSRIKSIFANITEEDARAKGYIKGNQKKDEVFTLLKRITTPQTVYKKQKLDRDDVIDITDLDVVGWVKAEMRLMLDEELARAILVGDGRSTSSDDKINETNIRPIWKDEDFYTIKVGIDSNKAATSDAKAKAFIRSMIKARKNYKGSGDLTLYTTEDVLTDCLLLEDTTGRIIYDSVEKLATAMRVKEIVAVPVMENLVREDKGTQKALLGIAVDLNDYNVGADRGGAVNLFDDFDIDYNAMKYLIETRCSGALIKPYSAIAIETFAGAES